MAASRESAPPEPWMVSEQRAALDEREAPARVRVRAAILSLVVGIGLLGVKYLAYKLTGSIAILSDALESIVNVIAALFALGGLVVAGWPADRNHPYGRGKVEFFSAAFEGGMIAVAAVLIIKEAGEALLFGHQVKQLEFGLMVTVGAGLANAALGWHLLRTGRKYRSPTLVADGRHVLVDFWTSVATAVGLGLVMLTDMEWLDAVVAAMVGLNLVWTGLGLVRHAAGGLLDEEDLVLMKKVVGAINADLLPGVIRVHFPARHPLRPLHPRRRPPGSAGILDGRGSARLRHRLRAPRRAQPRHRRRDRLPRRPVPSPVLRQLRGRALPDPHPTVRLAQLDLARRGGEPGPARAVIEETISPRRRRGAEIVCS